MQIGFHEHGFLLHVRQSDLGDRREVVDSLLGVLSEVRDGAKVCVQQTSRDLKRVLTSPPDSLQNTQTSASLYHTGKLQLHHLAVRQNIRLSLNEAGC